MGSTNTRGTFLDDYHWHKPLWSTFFSFTPAQDACVAHLLMSKNNARALNRTLFQAHKDMMIRFLEREDYYNPFQCAAAVAVFFLHPKSTSAMFILVGKKAFSTARG